MTNQSRQSDILVCIPFFNNEDTITKVVQPIVDHSTADILLIDDHSQRPLSDFLEERLDRDMEQITVLRPEQKVYSGGAKNIGIKRAIEGEYRILLIVEADIIVPDLFVDRVRSFFRDNSQAVIVAPPILPYGRWCQYADTLINFSTYLPDPDRDLSRKSCLAGYAFALNLDLFRHNPCYFITRYGGDDILFFRLLEAKFGLDDFPILNRIPVVHQPPRSTLRQALTAQRRYGRAFFTYNDHSREYLFNKIPFLHLLTPRFWLMVTRLVRRRRFRDLLYAPLCWCLDFARAIEILRLSLAGYRDPECEKVLAELASDTSSRPRRVQG